MTDCGITKAKLDRIMHHIRQDSFGGRDAPQVRLADGTVVSEDGAIAGSLEVTIRTRNGETALLHSQPLDGINDEKALKDAFAEALSKVLSQHSNWPR